MKTGKRSFLAGKGFYLVLLLCVTAVAVSGYVVFSDDREELSEPVNMEIWEPDAETETEREEQTESAVPTEKDDAAQEVAAPLSYTMPVAGSVSQSFSGDTLVYSATLDDWRTHNGVDIACEMGSEVKAITRGVVVAVSSEGTLGNAVTVEHAGGFRAVYANLDDSMTLAVGDQVEAGSPIGRIGDSMYTESAEQTHLHLEVMKNEGYIDPMILFDE
ncbi:MAG: M23 family metallopeptidase [Clostridia bacterium]|nr:M23 family metallopeptidase [Clostridia bacterium]